MNNENNDEIKNAGNFTEKQIENLDRITNQNDYKIAKEKIKAKKKKEKEEISTGRKKFGWRNFFTKWFFIGLILIFISIIISLISDMCIINNIYSPTFAVKILSGVLSSVGIALIIGGVFDFSRNSESFMGFVSDILSDIVVSKKFLASLTNAGKRDALEMILKPTDRQIVQYSNINEYFKKKIEDSMKMFDTNFKTNLILNIEARINKEEGFVYCESLLTYTVYRNGEKFAPIRVSYEKNGSYTGSFKIITDKGEKEIKPKDESEQIEEISGGIIQTTYTYYIPDEYSDFDKITIQRKMYEPGWNHWINYCWESLTPYEGLACHLQCFDGLTIKDFMIYDNRAYYHTEISDDRTSIDITSSQWLEPDTGFYITVSNSAPDATGQKGSRPTGA